MSRSDESVVDYGPFSGAIVAFDPTGVLAVSEVPTLSVSALTLLAAAIVSVALLRFGGVR
jgi:hypothetical protein